MQAAPTDGDCEGPKTYKTIGFENQPPGAQGFE
jgi:hypothetical protein